MLLRACGVGRPASGKRLLGLWRRRWGASCVTATFAVPIAAVRSTVAWSPRARSASLAAGVAAWLSSRRRVVRRWSCRVVVALRAAAVLGPIGAGRVAVGVCPWLGCWLGGSRSVGGGCCREGSGCLA